MVKDIAPGGDSTPQNLTRVGKTVFFAADDGVNGLELWKTDGTTSGTVLVKDIEPGPGWSNLLLGTVVGSHLYFSADDGTHGIELWRSDGTAAGTTLVHDAWSGDSSGNPTHLTPLAGTLFYVVMTPDSGREVWRTDGTAAGTVLVKDIYPGKNTGDPSPTFLTVAGRRLFFAADDGVNGKELWVSTGTEDGTRMLRDINVGSGDANPSELVTMSSRLMFSASTGAHGVELWSFDTTEDDIVTWSPTLGLKVGESPVTFAVAAALSGSAITYAVTDAGATGCAVANASLPVLTFSAAGRCVVRASTASSVGFRGGSASVTFVVAAADAPPATTVAPAKVLPVLTAKKPVSVKTLLNHYGITPPKKSKVTLSVRRSSAKVCRVAKPGLRYVGPGRCGFTLTVQPPKLKSGKTPKAIKRSGVLITRKK